MSCDARDLGAYVLGALDPAERSRLEAHLAGCTACRDELAELAGLPGLLGRLTPEEAERGLPAPTPRVLERLLAEAASTRRKRRLLVGAAAAAVLVVGGTLAGVSVGSPPAPYSITASAGAVYAQAELTATPAGTTIRLRLRGVPAGQRCRLLAITREGRVIDAGSWYATGQGYAGVTETAAVPRADLASLRVQTLDGAPLVTISL